MAGRLFSKLPTNLRLGELDWRGRPQECNGTKCWPISENACSKTGIQRAPLSLQVARRICSPEQTSWRLHRRSHEVPIATTTLLPASRCAFLPLDPKMLPRHNMWWWDGRYCMLACHRVPRVQDKPRAKHLKQEIVGHCFPSSSYFGKTIYQ